MTITRYEMVRGDYDRHQMTEQDDGDYATPADAQAALTAIERAAYERGVRDAADQFNDGGQLVNPRAVILALLTQEGR